MEAARIVEVHAGEYGSGYLVAAGVVLTARHLVTDPSRIVVRFLQEAHDHEGTLAWASQKYDAALITIGTSSARGVSGIAGAEPNAGEDRAHGVGPGSGAGGVPATGAGRGSALGPVRWGRLIGCNPGIPWETAGFPRAQRLANHRRGLEFLRGELDPLTGAPHSLQLPLPDPVPSLSSPWPGFSGAAVTCYGLVTAMVTDSMPTYDHRRLLAIPVERLLADPGFRRVLAEAGCSDITEQPVELAPILTAPPLPAPGLSPASLLRADAETIGFRGRAEEVRRLLEWCDGSEVSVRLLTGPGGRGKTRLAYELARILRDKGWMIGTLAHDADLRPVRDVLAGLRVPTLLVHDYAESQPDSVRDLVSAAMGHRGPSPLRILLLARAAGEWWRQLIDGTGRHLRDVLTTAPVDELGALPVGDREGVFIDTARSMARRLGGGAPKPVTRPDLSPDRFGSPLSIAMEALAALLAPGSAATAGGAADVVLDHERPYWSSTAKAYRVMLEPEDQRTAVAAAALCGATDETEALALLRRLPGLGDDTDDGHQRRRRTARWLRDLYPAPRAGAGAADSPNGGSTHWGSLQPDLLAEHLVAVVAREDRGFLSSVLAAPSAAQARQAMRVLTRAALHQPDMADRITDLLDDRPDLSRHAVAVAPQIENPAPLLSALAKTVDRMPPSTESLKRLWELTEAFPTRSRLLADLEYQVHRTIVALQLDTDSLHTAADQDAFAAAAITAAQHMASLGRPGQAVQGFQLAVSYYEWFAEQVPGLFLPRLATALAKLADQLVKVGDRHNATAAIHRAMDIAERLAAEDSGTHRLLLASVLSTFACMFPKSRTDEALSAMRRSVALYEQAPGKQAGEAQALGAALGNLSAICTAANLTEEALAHAQRAVEIYEPLAQAEPDAYQAGLAKALHGHAVLLMHHGRFGEALDIAERAVELCNELVTGSFARYGTDFLHMMLTLGFLRLEAARPGDAAASLTVPIRISQLGAIELSPRDTTTYQAFCLLRSAYREAPEDVVTRWQQITGEPAPDWLDEENGDSADEEVRWYRRAAENGDPNAVLRLAALYDERGEATEAEIWLGKAATAGNTTVMTWLGNLLRRQGRLVEAAVWWRKAAEAGDHTAITELATYSLVRGELAEAKNWSQKSAVLGDVRAMNVLGLVLMQSGELAEAETWLSKAAQAGDANAANNLLHLVTIRRSADEDALRTIPSTISWNFRE
ncbi:hypothetical protein [Streptosporangium sp. NPDC049046]|uniref:hypothetical protein n=1 Tax=Streptosporangium sp. NPDC049046 TaxID=3155031 RepID=UPI0034144A36